jgi:hypothetical protein
MRYVAWRKWPAFMPFLIPIAVQLPLIAIAGARNVDRINPDAVAYLRVAKYYLDGRFDLAVNGYWGPLFSWLAAPWLLVTSNPLVAARLTMGLSAVLFLLGALRLLYTFRLLPFEILLAGLLTALFTVIWSVEVITPDLLQSGLLLLGLSYLIPTECIGLNKRHFCFGLICGAAYLAKAVALPVSVGLLVVIQSFKALVKATPFGASGRAIRWSLLGLSLITLPWVTVISKHYGTFTVSTSARINHTLVGPPNVNGSPRAVIWQQAPDAGRISTWEDPSTLRYDNWSPLDSAEALRYQIWLAFENVTRILSNLRNFDLIGLGLTSSVICFMFCGKWHVALYEQPWRLSVLIILVACGVYLPVFSDDPRYYLVCFPLLLASAFGFLRDFSEAAVRGSGSMFWEKLYRFLVLGLVTVCFLVPLKSVIGYLKGRPTDGYLLAKEVTDSLSCTQGGPIASVGNRNDPPFLVGLYTSFLSGRAYYGNRDDTPSVGDVLSSKALVLIVDPSSKLNSALAADPRMIPSFCPGIS